VSLIQELERQKETKRDYIVDSRNISMTPDEEHNLYFSGPDGGDLIYTPNEWCHKQIGSKLAIPSRYYDRMKSDAPFLLAENVNTWLEQSTDKRMIRTLDGKARAFLSDRFKTMDNVDLLFVAAPVLRDHNAHIIRADADERKLYIRAICPDLEVGLPDPNGNPSSVVGGIIISNSEVGASTLSVQFYGMVMWCTNGMIGEKLFSKKHLGERLEEGIYQADTIQKMSEVVMLQLRDVLINALSLGYVEDYVNQIREARGVEIPVSVTELVQGSWAGVDINEQERQTILKHLLEDGEGLTQFGFSQAVTATARDHTLADRTEHLEQMGYRYTTMPKQSFERECIALSKISKRQPREE